MATFVRYNTFAFDLATKQHNLNADTIKVALSNTAPNVAHTTLSQIGQISSGNGYPAGGIDTANAVTQNGAQARLSAQDVTFTASGGSIPDFRYVILYNDTNDRLIGYYDHGSVVSLTDESSYTTDFPTIWGTFG